jgi:hypothetical protein
MERWGRVLIATGLVLVAARSGAENHQDFDNPGTAHSTCAQVGPPALVMRDPAGTDFSGRHLRLVTAGAPNQTSAVFAPAMRNAGRDLDLAFDFRITQVTGRGDGVGIALLRQDRAEAPCVEPQGPLFAAEEPNFPGALGIGFDVRQNAPHDLNGNHVSIHYDGAQVAQISTGSLDLARPSPNWIHVRIRLRPVVGGSRITILLKPRGGAPVRTVANDLLLPNVRPYPWRLWIGGRAAGGEANNDIDNVHVVPTTGQAHLDGLWELAPLTFDDPAEQALPIHTHLLPTGKVMFWDRSDYTPPGDHMPRLWDPQTGELTMGPDPGYDVFCAGHALMEDGRLFVAGGHIEDHNGEPHASTYNPFTNTWDMHPAMNAGRWYPTVTALADGTMLVHAGSFFDAGGNQIQNDLPQVFDPAAGPMGEWRDLTTARMIDSFYPFMYQAPNGKVFDAGPRVQARYLDTSGTGAWTLVARSQYGQRNYGSSAMYRLGRVAILGGSPSDLSEPPTNSMEVIDLADAVPAWRYAPSMAFARRQHTTTLLPDGTMLVTGGSSVRGHSNWLGAVYHPELWDPATERWRTLAPMREARLYHSTVLLLPDARLLVAGGGHPRDEENAEPDHFQAEIYSPPYLFKGPRPTITAAPDTIGYGAAFDVQTPDADAVTAVSLIRLGSVTHGFDQNQRLLSLAFEKMAGALRITAPPTGAVAPPGHYMLFILRDGVPSVARILRLTAAAPVRPATRPGAILRR